MIQTGTLKKERRRSIENVERQVAKLLLGKKSRRFSSSEPCTLSIESYFDCVQITTESNKLKQFASQSASSNSHNTTAPTDVNTQNTYDSLDQLSAQTLARLLPNEIDIETGTRGPPTEVQLWIDNQIEPSNVLFASMELEAKRTLANLAAQWLVDAIKHAHLDRRIKNAATLLLACPYFTKNMEYFQCFEQPFRAGLRSHLVALGKRLQHRHTLMELNSSLFAIEIESVTRYHALLRTLPNVLPLSSSQKTKSSPSTPTIVPRYSQVDVIPRASLSERAYLQVLQMVAIATDELFQDTVKNVIVGVGLNPQIHFRSIKPKSYVRMLNAMYNREKHRFLPKPRCAHNTDLIRNLMISPSTEQLKQLYKALVHQFGGVLQCTNSFSFDDLTQAKQFHVLSVLAKVVFSPKGLTFGMLCEMPSVKALWSTHRNIPRGEPPARWSHLCDEALTFLKSAAMHHKQVQIIGEVRLLLKDDAWARYQMYSPLKAWHLASGHQLYMNFKHDTPFEIPTPASTLSAACRLGQVLGAKSMLVQPGVNVNLHHSSGVPPIVSAALNGHVDIVTMLLDHEAVVDQPTWKGETALFKAAENSHMDVAALLLDKGARVNKAREGDGFTPLAMACMNGHTDVVELLLTNGASVNQYHSSDTPLHIASEHGHLDVAMLLIDHAAQVDHMRSDGTGTTALHVAVSQGFLDVVALLLDRDANVNKVDYDGTTAFHMAAQSGNVHVLDFLINREANVHQETTSGANALYVAAQSGHVDVVRFLVSHKKYTIDIDRKTKGGSTALHAASHHGFTEVVTYLLDNSARVDCQDNNGATALHMASQSNCVDVASVLLEHRAAVDHQAHNGTTALIVAAQQGYHALAWLLLSRNANVELCVNDGRTALHTAAQHGHLDVVVLMIEHNAKVDVEAVDERTPLCLASDQGHLDVVKLLVERFQANVEVSSPFGSPLHNAVMKNQHSVVEYLQSVGAPNLERGMRVLIV